MLRIEIEITFQDNVPDSVVFQRKAELLGTYWNDITTNKEEIKMVTVCVLNEKGRELLG